MISLLAALAIASAPAPCSWEHPGANKYQPAPHYAVADYHLDAETAGRLQYRLQTHQYDEVVVITRDSIGDGKYTDLREMHFGQGKVCHGPVVRTGWQQDHTEIGLVYCEGDVCIIVPTICNNVSLVTRRPDAVAEEPPIVILPAAGLPPVPDVQTADTPVTPPQEEETPYTPIYTGYAGGFFDGGGGFGGGGGGSGIPPIKPPVTSVPEPHEWLLMLVGLVVLVRRMR